MSALSNLEAYATSQSVADDQQRAERLLFALASDLRHVPIEERTRALHVRALELKGAVSRWCEQPPDATVRQGVCEEVMGLHVEARSHLRSAY